jgi:mRNA interferase MazF
VTIRQGDIYHVNLRTPQGFEPGFPHYVVVIQSDDFNRSNIKTVIVCELTSVLRRANAPGNVLLAPGEGGLPQQSVVNVSRFVTLNKDELGARIGALDFYRMHEVMDGIRLVLEGEPAGS